MPFDRERYSRTTKRKLGTPLSFVDVSNQSNVMLDLLTLRIGPVDLHYSSVLERERVEILDGLQISSGIIRCESELIRNLRSPWSYESFDK